MCYSFCRHATRILLITWAVGGLFTVWTSLPGLTPSSSARQMAPAVNQQPYPSHKGSLIYLSPYDPYTEQQGFQRSGGSGGGAQQARTPYFGEAKPIFLISVHRRLCHLTWGPHSKLAPPSKIQKQTVTPASLVAFQC